MIPGLKKEIQTVINNIQPDVCDRVLWKTASLDAVPPRDTISRMFFNSSIGNVTNYNQILSILQNMYVLLHFKIWHNIWQYHLVDTTATIQVFLYASLNSK